MLEQYRAVAESEEYKSSPAYRLQEYLKQFQRESGYNDVFIPARQRLSPAYREYHKFLQAANEAFLRHFQQEWFCKKVHRTIPTHQIAIDENRLCFFIVCPIQRGTPQDGKRSGEKVRRS